MGARSGEGERIAADTSIRRVSLEKSRIAVVTGPRYSFRFRFFLFLLPIAFVSLPTLPSRASITATNEMAISGQTTWRSSVIRDYRPVSD